MNKTHLIINNDYYASCNNKLWTSTDKEGTRDMTEVDCGLCQKTKEYKRLKSEQKKEIDKEMQDIKNEVLKDEHCHNCKHEVDLSCTNDFIRTKEYKFDGKKCQKWEAKSDKPKTYKQKIEIEIDVPVDLQVKEISERNVKMWREGTEIRVEFEKKVKTGAELVGCLCYLTDYTNVTETNYSIIAVVDDYDGTYCCGEEYYEHAYPISAEKINQLKKELEK